jgi:hypothetical protein
MKKGEKTADKKFFYDMLSKSEENLDPSYRKGEKEETWVHGIKTDFNMHQIAYDNIDELEEEYMDLFEDEGLVTDVRKGENFVYVFGVSQDQRYGKAVMLIMNEDEESIIVIPASHAINDPDVTPPELPERIKHIFGDLDLKKTIFSHSQKRSMLVFPFPLPHDQVVDRISQKMNELGYTREELKEKEKKRAGTLMYFTRGEKECFFEVTPIDNSNVNIFTAEYPK